VHAGVVGHQIEVDRALVNLEDVLVEHVLCDGRGLVGAAVGRDRQPELEPALVVGGDVDGDLHRASALEGATGLLTEGGRRQKRVVCKGVWARAS